MRMKQMRRKKCEFPPFPNSFISQPDFIDSTDVGSSIMTMNASLCSRFCKKIVTLTDVNPNSKKCMKCSLPSVHEALRDEFVKLSGTDSPWVIDSGATHNIACDKQFVTGYAPQESGSLDKETGEENQDVEFADGNSAPLDGQGMKSFEMCSIV